jgi:hypothetical protein
MCDELISSAWGSVERRSVPSAKFFNSLDLPADRRELAKIAAQILHLEGMAEYGDGWFQLTQLGVGRAIELEEA